MTRACSLRWTLPLVSAFAGVCSALPFAASCSMLSECECSAPRSIVEGTFDAVDAKIPENAPASLRDIDVTRLVIADGTVVVHYTRGAEPGAATFTFGTMY